MYTSLFLCRDICRWMPPQNKEIQWSCCTLFHKYTIFILDNLKSMHLSLKVKDIFFAVYILLCLCCLFSFFFSLLILLVMQNAVTRNGGRWMPWEDGRRSRENTCSRKKKGWEDHAYHGLMCCCSLVITFQSFKGICHGHFSIHSECQINICWMSKNAIDTYSNRFYIYFY